MKPAYYRGTLFTTPVVVMMALMAWLPGNAFAQESMSLDLDTAVQMATTHNRKAQMREDEVEAAVYRRKQATGRSLPTLSLSARYSRVSHVEPGSLSATDNVQLGEAVDDQYSLRMSVEQPIFTGFALRNGRRAAEHTVALSQQRVRAERADVRVIAQEAYFNLLKAQEMQMFTVQLVQTLEEHLQSMQLLYDAGRATELDVSRAKSRVASARLSFVQVEGAKDGAHLALTTLLGIPSTTELELAEIVDDWVPESLPDSEQLVVEALASRPEIRIATESAAVATASAIVEGAALWPQVSLNLG